MTDKQQPEALRIADELEEPMTDFPQPTKLEAEAAAELRRLHAELETLRAKLKTYEDLGGAGSDVQLLRMGYAAARLEIESLRDEVKEYRHAAGVQKTLIETLLAEKPAGAQQPGAAYGALPVTPQFPAHPEPMVMGWSAIEISAIAQYGRDMYEAGKRASHGQAPAQAAPAAVAGPADTFRGDTTCLVQNIVALLELDADGALVPHGIGGHARALLSAAASRLAAPTTQPAPQQEAQEPVKLSDEQLKAHGDKASRMMARDLTRFDAACEVNKYLREQGTPYYYMHRMCIVLFGNDEGTEAARAADTDPQPSPAAQGDARSMLRIAADYSDWLDSKGRLTSFSAFVNEFGYEERDCKTMYEKVVLPCIDAARAAQEDKSCPKE